MPVRFIYVQFASRNARPKLTRRIRAEHAVLFPADDQRRTDDSIELRKYVVHQTGLTKDPKARKVLRPSKRAEQRQQPQLLFQVFPRIGTLRVVRKNAKILPSLGPIEPKGKRFDHDRVGPRRRHRQNQPIDLLRAADRKLLRDISDELARSVDLGTFSIIAKGLLWLLEFFHKYVHNWGVAIIMLTFVIKALFWPLTAKSYASMEKMKKLQPMMTAIREKYKNDKEQMNKEVMALYKTYGVNPASGCVPVLIQLPVFFGLYQALLTAIELRHAPLVSTLPFTDKIWLADLSAKDPFYITPVIMGVTMFLQQRMSPPATDPMQQKIMMFLPIIFTFLFLGFPAGLVVYWLVNNILSIFQQWLMMRKSGKARAA